MKMELVAVDMDVSVKNEDCRETAFSVVE